jgi:hypothetical protein
VLITESPEGGWGIDGHANTGDDIVTRGTRRAWRDRRSQTQSRVAMEAIGVKEFGDNPKASPMSRRS